MDIYATLQQLYAEKALIDNAIEYLSTIQDGRTLPPKPPPGKRGRKSMNAAERLEVSERMRKYWGERRQQRTMEAGT